MKKVAYYKQATLPREVSYTRAFLKSWEKLDRSGRYDMAKLKQVMLLLIAGDMPLGKEWLDHPLKGEWQDCRECHIGGDFLLIYKIEKGSKADMIIFTGLGTHAELFK